MEPEITAAIIAVVVTPTMTLILWYVQKLLNKKKNKTQEEKAVAETDNVDSETIQNLVETVDDLLITVGKLKGDYTNELFEKIDLTKEMQLQSKEISRLEAIISEQSKRFSRENAEMLVAFETLNNEYSELLAKFDNLKKENESLRRLLIDKQIKEENVKDVHDNE